MTRRDDEPSLFDLPLTPPEPGERPRPVAPPPATVASVRTTAPGATDPGATAPGRTDPEPRQGTGAGELPLFGDEDGGADEPMGGAWPAARTSPPAGPEPGEPSAPPPVARGEGRETATSGARGSLFDDEELASLAPPPTPARAPRSRPLAATARDPLALALDELPLPEPAVADADEADAVAAAPQPAGVGKRLAAALCDGVFLGAVGALAVVGGALLGAFPDRQALPALVGFLLVFSFAYAVVPLAFWGRTPGMSLVGLAARGTDGGPLTFGQTALRWLGGLLTLLLAGLPLLLAWRPLGGRSLPDLLSGSRTWVVARPGPG